VWDINEALDLIKGGNWPNAANLSPDTFVDALFQATIWDGNGSNQTITNNIDLSNKGGLVWIKTRDQGLVNGLFDTERGIGSSFAYRLISDDTGAQSELADGLSSFNSNGFTLGSSTVVNGNTYEYVGWTFREQPKFFDVVTYTGDGTNGRQISHNLNSDVGMAIIKKTSASGDWWVWHRSAPNNTMSILNSTNAFSTSAINSEYPSEVFGDGNFDQDPTSTFFEVSSHASNENGVSYVAYLFAHNNDDGGFGEPGDQDIIKCGSYTGNGNDDGPEITLGFEPQFFMFKKSSGSGGWFVYDVNRGFTDESGPYLSWNDSSAEQTSNRLNPTSTGIKIHDSNDAWNENGATFVYMAIRRGGMQTPSTPSTVFNIGTVQTDTYRTLTNSLTGKLNPDFVLYRTTADGANWFAQTRLMGNDTLFPNTTAAANTSSYGNSWGKVMHNVAADGTTSTGTSSFGWMWARARGYFDVVAYTGTGSNRTVSHNLGVTPEMMWIKCRSNTDNWVVFHKDIGATKILQLNNDIADTTTSTRFNDTAPTSSVFTVGTDNEVNGSSRTYIAYLFATVAGVSKIGSYTGDGSAGKVIDCGFTNGAKFVLIKELSSSHNWFVYDTERGISSGNDPYLWLNTTNAQNDQTDSIDPDSSGFAVNYANTNSNGDSYIFYAIAADPS
jgi:hypothetical protein